MSVTALQSRSCPMPKKPSNYYFDNPKVEALLTVYVAGGCVEIDMRDEIMAHATELINQVIRTHNLHNIYGGGDDASFDDLFQTAWIQIESTLYKFDSAPGHAKVFNMWSQVAKTVVLAYIKKESRDKKNSPSYRTHLNNPPKSALMLNRFLSEAREMFKYNKAELLVLSCIEKLYEIDVKPHEGLIGKLVELSGLPRNKVSEVLKQIKLRCFEYTDAPVNEERFKRGKSKNLRHDYETD